MSVSIKSLAQKFEVTEAEVEQACLKLALGGAPELTGTAAALFETWADEYAVAWPGSAAHDRPAVAKREAAAREAAQKDMVRATDAMQAAAKAEQRAYLDLCAAARSGDRGRYDSALRAHGEAEAVFKRLVHPAAQRVMPNFTANRDVL